MRAINVKRQERSARGDRSAAALRGARSQVLMLGSRASFAQNEPMDYRRIAVVVAGGGVSEVWIVCGQVSGNGSRLNGQR